MTINLVGVEGEGKVRAEDENSGRRWGELGEACETLGSACLAQGERKCMEGSGSSEDMVRMMYKGNKKGSNRFRNSSLLGVRDGTRK